MLKKYLKSLYDRTMAEAYSKANFEIVEALKNGGVCLDCGCQSGQKSVFLNSSNLLNVYEYKGIEWDNNLVVKGQKKGLDIIQGDLNKDLPYGNNSFQCIYGLSVLEHLLNPCNYLRESYRCLASGGTLVLLTPNISTYFTALQIIMGKMPSSGPHPDSNSLLQKELYKVSKDSIKPDAESDNPLHRHLVVFSYRVLSSYLEMIGFNDIKAYGFGLYPFPNFIQPVLERIDPYHCHQMVFVAKK